MRDHTINALQLIQAHATVIFSISGNTKYNKSLMPFFEITNQIENLYTDEKIASNEKIKELHESLSNISISSSSQFAFCNRYRYLLTGYEYLINKSDKHLYQLSSYNFSLGVSDAIFAEGSMTFAEAERARQINQPVTCSIL